MDGKGLVHIYTGEGKGKTTAAIGLGIRACGSGMKVMMVQFLKSGNTSELHSIARLQPDFCITRGYSAKKFTWNMDEEELAQAAKEAAEIFEGVKATVMSEKYDLVILDELLGVLSLKFLEEAQVVGLIKNKPEAVELVLTGRNAPEALIEAADYVSEIKALKHPYEKGIKARKGIEY